MHLVEIEDINSEGDGVGSIDGKKIFVEDALPGELAEVEITESKKRYCKGIVKERKQTSPDRVDPICPLFGTCGACQLMHLSYEKQLLWKQSRVKSTLKRIAGIDIEVAPCEPSPKELNYRNKVHLHHGGLYKKGTHETVKIEKCYLLNETIGKVLPTDETIEDVVIKASFATGELLISRNGKSHKKSIMENLGELKFKVRINDFFQVNPLQTVNLYEKTIELAGIHAESKVLDAYCGVGALSLFAAKKAKKLIGIESGTSAIQSAKENAEINGISNAEFIKGRVEDKLKFFEGVDVAFLNPPRGGINQKVIKTLLDEPIKRLIYISCDPATLSRDLKLLSGKYQVLSVHPFDMFPQTVHVETLVVLKRQG